MEALIFISLLVAGALLGLPMLYAVLAGLAVFFVFGLRRGIPANKLFGVMIPGFKKSLKIVSVILLLGAMSAAWRASGLMALLVVGGLSLIYAPLFFAFYLSFKRWIRFHHRLLPRGCERDGHFAVHSRERWQRRDAAHDRRYSFGDLFRR